QPYSLVVFEDTVYWIDWIYQELLSCNKIACHLHHPMFQHYGAGRGFFGTTVYHPVLQRSQAHTINPCESHSCSHMCLIRSPNSYTCHCPEHSELASDQR